MPQKFCLFCGEPPNDKTREHVLPRWLIALTGDESRTATFGFDLSADVDEPKPRRFAFSQFHFPACKACNNRFGALERLAKPIVVKLLERMSLTPREASTLLDWLDKVRVGLWLGIHQLDKNVEGIRPRFYVEHRVARKDRMLLLGYSLETQKHLSFAGPTLLAFRWLPSAFSLVVNNLFLVNISSDFLLARRLGFPYPQAPGQSLGRYMPDYIALRPGLGRVLRPIFRGALQFDGIAFHQPIFPLGEYPQCRPLY